MLFDIYFSLGSFCLGLCTVGAYVARAKGDDRLLSVAISLLVFALFSIGFRWHLRTHAAEKEWSFFRRFVPVVFYLLGIAIVASIEWRTLVG